LAKEKAYEEKIVKLILLKEGTYNLEETLTIACPISIHGAGQDNTIIQGRGIDIRGTKEEKKIVGMQGVTMKGSSQGGLYAYNGLSFLCKDMTFTQCEYHGVEAINTKGRLINCVITQCGKSGIICTNALIELEGIQTKVDGNGTSLNDWYGLVAYDRSSIIHLLFPLTKESVSTDGTGTGNMNTIKNDATNKYWTHFDDFVETNSMHHDTVADCITTLVRAIDLAKGVATQYV